MTTFRRVRITRDVPAPLAGFMGLPAAPRLLAGDVLLAFDGPTAGLDPACVAAVVELGRPWFGVAKDAVEEI